MTSPPFTGSGPALGPVIRVDPAELERAAAAALRSADALRAGGPALASAWQRAATGLVGTATGAALGVCAGRAAAVTEACAVAMAAYSRALSGAAVVYRATESAAVPASALVPAQRSGRP